eukprot:6182649-Pleurochrysis_carterae.AAC.1
MYEAYCSWVVHESLEHTDLSTAALARVERIVEVHLGGVRPPMLYVQLLRYPGLVLELNNANIASVTRCELSAASTQDELLLLDLQAITPLQCTFNGDRADFVFLR